MNKPKPRPNWNARGAAVKQKMRHDIKFGVTNKFKTRTHGTPKQVGKVFPTGNKLPIAQRPKATNLFLAGRSPLAFRGIAKKEAREMFERGFEGYSVAIRFKDGNSKVLPIQARDAAEAIDKTNQLMHQFAGKPIVEISILSGGKFRDDVKELFHKVGPEASKSISAIKTGLEKNTKC